ncbi:TIGR02206 family membrane protein [Metabacillus idriensis]|uniref:YwaF family protein n=1 Tax=Metabacillus idriensis TaxID=324768 RepID=UPI0028137926|nr:TIGR02206 family membrane protein [Metabacillus idriensis]MDR0137745.1 TIGR02206 family membrane protein [Metabacillus idriensis]
MNEYFQHDPKLEDFRLFSAEHIWTLAIILFLTALLVVFKERIKLIRGPVRIAIAVILFLSMFVQQLWLISERAWTLKSSLPLQLSDLAVLLAIIMLMAKSFRMFQFLYFAGIASSIQAILTPDLGPFSFPHFQYIVFFLSHGGVILACIFMIVSYHFLPSWRSLWISVLIVNLYAGSIYLFNKIIGSNYLYIMKKPENASLLDYLGGWPWYLLWMEAIMIASFLFLYGCMKIKEQRS